MMKNYLWIFALAGIWLMIAPFVLDYSQTSSAALWNDVIVGILIVVVGLFGYAGRAE